jgi:hypothetical protein
MTNHSGAGDIGIADDVCLDNGLCQNFAAFNGQNEGEPMWGRQGCTDPLWNSPYCLADVCNKPEVFSPCAPIEGVANETVLVRRPMGQRGRD